MELRPFREVQALEFNNTVFLPAIRNVDTFIDGKPIDLSPLMIYMSSEGRNPVRAESYSIRGSSIGLEVYFFTSHSISLFSGNLVPVVQALFSSRNTLYTTQQKLSSRSEYQS